MKVIFLDIDGVLNSIRSAIAFGGYPHGKHGFSSNHLAKFDHVAVGLIRKVCKETGSIVVLSSTWRINIHYQEAALRLNLPIIDATPRLHTLRGLEIQQWLHNHPEVERYAIVDDNSDMLPEQFPFFVQTNTNNGLLFEHYEQLLTILGSKTPTTNIQQAEDERFVE